MFRKLFQKKTTPPAPVNQYAIPDGEQVYAVGDIHGRYDLLQKLCAAIEADIEQNDGSKTTVVFLGDYIDRGFQSREVIDHLLALDMAGAEVVCLKGNHEQMLQEFLEDPLVGRRWLDVGGLAALASYGAVLDDLHSDEALLAVAAKMRACMPASHVEFIEKLAIHHRVGDYLFVHAGLRPAVALDEQEEGDLIGIRQAFTGCIDDFGFRVVHGHTGVRMPQVLHNRIAIDTGAFATGILTAAVLRSSHVSFLQTQ